MLHQYKLSDFIGQRKIVQTQSGCDRNCVHVVCLQNGLIRGFE